MKKLFYTLLVSLLIPFFCQANIFSDTDIKALKNNFLNNITSEGAVMASPSQTHPDYYYHWVRDGAISMDNIASWYEKDLSTKNFALLANYVQWVKGVQQTIAYQDKSPGEPKFYLDGAVYDKPWGRPQNDGPALRAITLIHMANSLLKQNNKDYIHANLYQASLNWQQMGAIKRDLEFTAHHWMDKHFDLWEESYGYHFFSSIVQRQALILGASLAEKLNDSQAHDYYLEQAKLIERMLLSFVDINHHIISTSLDATGPVKEKGLDASTILAFLYLDAHDSLYTYFLPYIENTAKLLEASFKKDYAINKQFKSQFLFGRYPGDTYNGYETDAKGNPWFILTATTARFHFQRALDLAPLNQSQSRREKAIGENYLAHLKLFIKDNHLSEQINRDTGKMQGANDLTWSYQALLQTLELERLLNSSA